MRNRSGNALIARRACSRNSQENSKSAHEIATTQGGDRAMMDSLPQSLMPAKT